MKKLCVLVLAVLCGCTVPPPEGFKVGDEVLFRHGYGDAVYWMKYTLSDVQGDKVQFAGNAQYFELSKIKIQKVLTAEKQ